MALAYFILRAFALLARVEKSIEYRGGDPTTILHYRDRYARKIWEIILKTTESVVNGTLIKGMGGRWPPKSPIYKACRYIQKNRRALLAYLSDARLAATNNLVERLLRPEKILQLNCKFRKSEQGRVVFDILRTMVQTCRAADVDFADYLRWLSVKRLDVEKEPEKFIPYAYRQQLDAKVPKAEAA